MTYVFRAACASLRRDLGHLRTRDRAAIRILNRAQAATASQLTVLVYRNRRLAQRRLQALWEQGFLERLPVPSAPRGGPMLAYRLSRSCLRRLGYRRTGWRGPGYLAHTLHTVDAVCALVGSRTRSSETVVQLWLPESIIDSYLLDGYIPDAIVVLSTGRRSAVLCLEIDEATQHVAPMRDKLRAYSRLLRDRRGWHALFVVPTDDRLAWLRHIAATTKGLDDGLWAVAGAHLGDLGVEAPVKRLGGDPGSARLEDVITDQRPRLSATPVGSQGWLKLLGSGGGEDVVELIT